MYWTKVSPKQKPPGTNFISAIIKLISQVKITGSNDSPTLILGRTTGEGTV